MNKAVQNKLFEYEIYLPFPEEIVEQEVERIHADARNSLMKKFGGLTETSISNDGFWKVGPLVVRDRIKIVKVLSDLGDEGDAYLADLRSKLEKFLQQDLILITKRDVTQI